MKFKDLTNQSFGYLTVLCINKERSSSHNKYWYCQCVCGKTRSLQTYQLTSGKVTSCGCKNTKRAYTRTEHEKRLYTLYDAMIQRCHNPKSKSYKSYGAKNIHVCDEWRNNFRAFIEWAINNGYASDLSIDRIDNTRGYSPSNCRWVTMDAQLHNMSKNVYFTHNGMRLIMADWCKIYDIPYNFAKSRRYYLKKHNIEPTFERIFLIPKGTRLSNYTPG